MRSRAEWGKKAQKANYACHCSLVNSLRNERGWSRKDLANASGYSLSLVNKFESGLRVSWSAIVVLAQALSTDDFEVDPRSLIVDSLASAEFFTEAFFARNENLFHQIGHFVASDVILELSGDPSVYTFAGVHRGQAAVEAALACLFAEYRPPEGCDWKSDCRFFKSIDGDDDVVVWAETPWDAAKNGPSGINISFRLTFEEGILSRIGDCDFEVPKLACLSEGLDDLGG